LSHSLDISTHGAKVKTKARLKTGPSVRPELVPPDGPPLQVEALVWRMDADGLAFLFSRGTSIDLSERPDWLIEARAAK
jgi:hypothetical protein